MAPGKPAAGKVATEFDAIINAERDRKKNQELASRIFGSKRRSSAPGGVAGGVANRRLGAKPSLASRIGPAGITKSQPPPRATSGALKFSKLNINDKAGLVPPPAGSIDAEWTHDLHGTIPRGPKAARGNRGERLYNAINSASSPALNAQFNIVAPPKPMMSIRGMAGPYTVVLKNFVQGTTAPDIEAAMLPVGGVCMRCDITSEYPVLTAEIIYELKESADKVVRTFHRQNADGNFLTVYHKLGPPQVATPAGLPADRISHAAAVPAPRDRTKQNYTSRAEVVDGSYGFDDAMDVDRRDNAPALYSDKMTSRGRGERERVDHRGRGGRHYN